MSVGLPLLSRHSSAVMRDDEQCGWSSVVFHVLLIKTRELMNLEVGASDQTQAVENPRPVASWVFHSLKACTCEERVEAKCGHLY
jgi:hypothetical protein